MKKPPCSGHQITRPAVSPAVTVSEHQRRFYVLTLGGGLEQSVRVFLWALRLGFPGGDKPGKVILRANVPQTRSRPPAAEHIAWIHPRLVGQTSQTVAVAQRGGAHDPLHSLP